LVAPENFANKAWGAYDEAEFVEILIHVAMNLSTRAIHSSANMIPLQVEAAKRIPVSSAPWHCVNPPNLS